MSTTVVWFRQDLRLRDNLALHTAAKRGPVIPLYIWAPEDEGDWPPGGASRWWLHQSLRALDESLRELGSRLIVRSGRAPEVLRAFAREEGATAIHWNRRYEPASREVAERVVDSFQRGEVETREFASSLLVEPEALLNGSGRPYRVYSAFRRRLLRDARPALPVNMPNRMRAPARWPESLAIEDLRLMPKVAWYREMAGLWQPGESGARAAWARFSRGRLTGYRTSRDRPAERGTSRLSPHLHFGEIGPRQIWHALGPRGRSSAFLSELLWREFAHHVLFHFPQTTDQPMRPQFARFPWRRNQRLLRAWQQGTTGIPLVDAGMRELWATGWMHNRVRMVVASLLVKNLMQPWQDGARWFWDTLVDADLANNTLNWQWVAGSGVDAAPYFRIFNPGTQAKRFDPGEAYVRRWPGPKGLTPVVDLRASREAALDAYRQLRT
jgi:deoxyribodipyrimidine photo-lyase